MENYRKLAYQLRNTNQCENCDYFSDCDLYTCLLNKKASDAIETLVKENEALRQIVGKQERMNEHVVDLALRLDSCL